ncbi:MAG TPA: PH domain-containing protein [Arenibacter sp.]|nr:PH domain-containing protein [Arenibacter sp.]
MLDMVKYKSKIGWVIILTIAGLLFSCVRSISLDSSGIGPIIILSTCAFIVYLVLYTYYEIGGSILRIKSGFLLDRSIPIKDIAKIEATNNPISAPATSLDRLEIFYGKYESIIISPKEKAAFIAHLKQINPKIQDNSGV